MSSDTGFHPVLFMPRSAANSGIDHARPSTSMRGSSISTQVPFKGVGYGDKQVRAKAHQTSVHSVSALHDVLASKMASQLLAYAGHPAFASFAKIKSELPNSYYDFPHQYEPHVASARPHSLHSPSPGYLASVEAGALSHMSHVTRPLSTCTLSRAHSNTDTRKSTHFARTTASSGAFPKTGWMNSLGDFFDVATNTWIRLPFETELEEELPPFRRAAVWHRHQVTRRVFTSWRCIYVPGCSARRCQLSRAATHAQRVLARKALVGLQMAMDFRWQCQTRESRATGHHQLVVKRRCLQAWRVACQTACAARDKAAWAVRCVQAVRLAHALHAWQEYVHNVRSKAAVQAWSKLRMKRRLLALCINALQQQVAKRQCKRLKGQWAVQHHRTAGLIKVMAAWWSSCCRSKRHQRLLARHQHKWAMSMRHAVFKAWQSVCLEEYCLQLEEHVTDLKRELAYAVAWSD